MAGRRIRKSIIALAGKVYNRHFKNGSYKIDAYSILRERAAVDSADFIQSFLDSALIFPNREMLWNHALQNLSEENGLMLEFGVHKAESINYFAKNRPQRTVYGFDSFMGLREDWVGYHLAKAHFDQGGKLPDVRDNIKWLYPDLAKG